MSILKVRILTNRNYENIDKLIAIYFHICRCYDTDLITHCQKISNNYQPDSTD